VYLWRAGEFSCGWGSAAWRWTWRSPWPPCGWRPGSPSRWPACAGRGWRTCPLRCTRCAPRRPCCWGRGAPAARTGCRARRSSASRGSGRCARGPRSVSVVSARHRFEPTHLQVGQGELDLAVQPAGPHQRRVERVRAVGGHEHLDVAARVEAVQLVDQLEHRALHLVVAAPAVVEAGPCAPRGVSHAYAPKKTHRRWRRSRRRRWGRPSWCAPARTARAPCARPRPRTSAPARSRWRARSRRRCGWPRRARTASCPCRAARRAARPGAARCPGWRSARAAAAMRKSGRTDALTHVQQRQLQHFAQPLDLLLAAAHVAVRHVGLLLNLNPACGWRSAPLRAPWVTCIIVTVGSIFGGRGRWIWYLVLSTLKVTSVTHKKQNSAIR